MFPSFTDNIYSALFTMAPRKFMRVKREGALLTARTPCVKSSLFVVAHVADAQFCIGMY